MGVKSSATVFRVLELLARQTEPVGAADLARSLSIPLTTVARALATLEAAGFAERYLASPRYVIGKSARTLAFAFMAQFPIRDLAVPYLQRLTLETGRTSSLFVRLGWYGLRIAAILGPSVLIHRPAIGEVRPLAEGAPCLAMLATLPPETVARVVNHFGLAENRDRLDRCCLEVRSAGFCIAASPSEAGVQDIAVALRIDEWPAEAAIAIEGASAEEARVMAAPASAARRIVHDLAAKIAEEPAFAMSHYDHIRPEAIRF